MVSLMKHKMGNTTLPANLMKKKLKEKTEMD
jgi:hypothetical protein